MMEARHVVSATPALQQVLQCCGTPILDMLGRAEAADPTVACSSLRRERLTAIRSFDALFFHLCGAKGVLERESYVEQLAYDRIEYGLAEDGPRAFRQLLVDAGGYFVNRSLCPDVWTLHACQLMRLYLGASLHVLDQMHWHAMTGAHEREHLRSGDESVLSWMCHESAASPRMALQGGVLPGMSGCIYWNGQPSFFPFFFRCW
ncbi:hypothetical_protein [Leishmania infantum]|uniref:Hypothetical_protein n=1 Tax=Leishmania infantum TaxID=5671 RepID=A0A6L0XQV8_LEIIN|nr:hypothetical_protein [Leishmania infantum]SUZ44370.1 hypothetical_protein [Leishmania infantum]